MGKIKPDPKQPKLLKWFLPKPTTTEQYAVRDNNRLPNTSVPDEPQVTTTVQKVGNYKVITQTTVVLCDGAGKSQSAPVPVHVPQIAPTIVVSKVDGTRVRYTIARMDQLIKEIDESSVAAVAAKRGVNSATLHDFLRRRHEIKRAIFDGRGHMFGLQPFKTYKQEAEAAYEFYLKQRESLRAVTPQLIIGCIIAKFPAFSGTSPKAREKFMKRWREHYGLSIRRRSSVSQLLPVDYKERVANFHKMLGAEYAKQRPTRLLFLDETAVLWFPAAAATFEQRGVHSVRIFSENEKKQSTALLWASADLSYDGDNVVYSNVVHGKPWIVYVGTPDNERSNSVAADARAIQKEMNDSVVCKVTKSGWVTEDVFREFCQSLPQRTAADGTAWLVMDLFAAHRTDNVLRILKEKGYVVFFVPGGCTSRVQVHDVVVNKGFNTKVKDDYLMRQASNGHKTMRVDIARSVIDALGVIPPQLLVKGIERCIMTGTVLAPVLAAPADPAAAAAQQAAEWRDSDIDEMLVALNQCTKPESRNNLPLNFAVAAPSAKAADDAMSISDESDEDDEAVFVGTGDWANVVDLDSEDDNAN